MKRFWKRLFWFSVTTPIIIVLGTAVWIYLYGKLDTDESAEYAIVLGAAAWHRRPSPIFKERINHAIDLYHRGQVNKIVFTGGRGVGVQDISLSESLVARNYAIEHGVAPRDILTETRSRTTRENLFYAREVMGPAYQEPAILISDPLHMWRSVSIGRDLGLNAYSSPTPTTRIRNWHNQLNFLVDETRNYLLYVAAKLVAMVLGEDVGQTISRSIDY